MPDLIQILIASPVTVGLVVANLTISILAFNGRERYLKWILHPYSIIRKREYRRIFTSGFVHNDAIHLLINTALIALICGEFERYLSAQRVFGSLMFLTIYLVSHFAGAAVVSWSNRKNFDHSSAGASGSILGCIMGFTVLAPEYVAFYLPFLGAIKNLFASLSVIIGLIFYKWRSGNEMVDHELHFFSAIGGIAIALMINTSIN